MELRSVKVSLLNGSRFYSIIILDAPPAGPISTLYKSVRVRSLYYIKTKKMHSYDLEQSPYGRLRGSSEDDSWRQPTTSNHSTTTDLVENHMSSFSLFYCCFITMNKMHSYDFAWRATGRAVRSVGGISDEKNKLTTS